MVLEFNSNNFTLSHVGAVGALDFNYNEFTKDSELQPLHALGVLAGQDYTQKCIEAACKGIKETNPSYDSKKTNAKWNYQYYKQETYDIPLEDEDDEDMDRPFEFPAYRKQIRSAKQEEFIQMIENSGFMETFGESSIGCLGKKEIFEGITEEQQNWLIEHLVKRDDFFEQFADLSCEKRAFNEKIFDGIWDVFSPKFEENIEGLLRKHRKPYVEEKTTPNNMFLEHAMGKLLKRTIDSDSMKFDKCINLLIHSSATYILHAKWDGEKVVKISDKCPLTDEQLNCLSDRFEGEVLRRINGEYSLVWK